MLAEFGKSLADCCQHWPTCCQISLKLAADEGQILAKCCTQRWSLNLRVTSERLSRDRDDGEQFLSISSPPWPPSPRVMLGQILCSYRVSVLHIGCRRRPFADLDVLPPAPRIRSAASHYAVHTGCGKASRSTTGLGYLYRPQLIHSNQMYCSSVFADSPGASQCFSSRHIAGGGPSFDKVPSNPDLKPATRVSRNLPMMGHRCVR